MSPLRVITRTIGRKKSTASLLLTVYTILMALQASSQGVNFGIPPMRNYTKKEYLAATQNWDASQNSKGLMFWANNDGLLQFDGTRWTTHQVANHTIVRSVAIDSRDRIYVGAQSELGYFSPGKDGNLNYSSLIHLLPSDHQNFEDVWDIVFLDGDVYFRTNKAVFQYSGGKMNILIPTGLLTAMFVTNEGLVIQQDNHTLLLLKDDDFIPFHTLPGLESAVTGCMPWKKDTMILSSLKHGLFYLTKENSGPWITAHDNTLREKRIYSATQLPNGYLALGTSLDGLLVMDNKRRIFRHLNKKCGIQNNNILHTFCDRSGNVWLGLDNGIDCIVMDSPFSNVYPDGEMQATGYAAAVHDNKLYLGVSNGVYMAPWQNFYDPEAGPVFKPVNGSDGQVWNLNALSGQLLMGHHEGVYTIDNGKAIPLHPGSGAWAFVQLSPEYMMGGTYEGLTLFRKINNKWVADRKLEGLKESCRIMVRDDEGVIWISHPYRGLYRIEWHEENKYELKVQFYDQHHGLPSNLNNYVFEIAGKAVIGTEQGVYHFQKNTGRFIPHEDLNRWLGDHWRIKSLKQDHDDNIWFVSDVETGVLLIDDYGLKKEVRKKVFPELHGKLVGGFEFIYPIDRRNIIFGTEQGFLHYDTQSSTGGDSLLQVHLSDVTASGNRDSLLFGGYALLNSEPFESPVLDASFRSLSFSFSATDYKNQSLIEYSTMLEGLENIWSAWSNDTRSNYTNLHPGNYTFKVRARIKDGRESDVVNYSFRIRPPWYKSPAALASYALLFVGFFAGFIFRQRQKFESEKTKMKVSHQRKEAQHMREVELSKAALTEIQNEKLEVEIKFKNQELASTTMHLVQKAEILLTVQEGLNQVLEKSTNPAVKKEIQHLINLLNFDVKLDEDWEHFAYHFDQVHVDFLKQLRERFPQLSSNDYKLCAYLRMNLSTKEIAPLMNISVRGVEGSRYRLRRKLNLSSDANLTDFILSLGADGQQHPTAEKIVTDRSSLN